MGDPRLSSSALERLGKRLAHADSPTAEDLVMLRSVIAAHDPVLQEARRQLLALGGEVRPTGRLKETATLIDKLRRGTRLNTVRDIAGLRLTGGNLNMQVVSGELLLSWFERDGANRKGQLVNRLRAPNNGYRAVHVIAYIGSVPVEIQIRTELQDLWAQCVEALEPILGRGIRYGEGPSHGSQVLGRGGSSTMTHDDLWNHMLHLSRQIAAVEEFADATTFRDLMDQVGWLQPLEAEVHRAGVAGRVSAERELVRALTSLRELAEHLDV